MILGENKDMENYDKKILLETIEDAKGLIDLRGKRILGLVDENYRLEKKSSDQGETIRKLEGELKAKSDQPDHGLTFHPGEK